MTPDPLQWLERPEPPLPDIGPDPEPPDLDDVPPDLPEPYRQPEGDPPGHAPPEREPPVHTPPMSAVSGTRNEALP
ncbi:hypothetical protein AAB992_25790 [Burkholderia contaminans]|uniref:hypothetical protein n=1 Tax=Burkholderia contaminans TaxID=488447 RepID=UPI002415F14C|nr:hypothetical protein [Burkholderia contaminans]WFN14722.1 hypothetical protein LXE92_38235 [Burkholderia contaminans]